MMRTFLIIISLIALFCFICNLSDSFRNKVNKFLNIKVEGIYYLIFGWIIYFIFIILKHIFL